MKLFILLYLLLLQTSSWSQSDTTRFVIRTYGFSSWNDYDQIEDSIAGNWDITYLPVAGCVVTDEFIDSIDRLNNTTYRGLEARYGADWKKRFYQEVDSAYNHLLYRKESTFQVIADCTTEQYSFKAEENLKQTGMKFTVNPKKAVAQNNHDVRLMGLQHVDHTILYRGYSNRIILEFGSFADTERVAIKSKGELYLSDSCPSSTKIQLRYRVPISVKYDTLFVETTDGNVLPFIFQVKHLEAPRLYFNEMLLDSTLSISTLNTTSVLSMHHENGCLVPERYIVHNWEISCAENKRFAGRGSIIPYSVIRKLKKLKPGTSCCIQITVSQNDSILRKKIVCFRLV